MSDTTELLSDATPASGDSPIGHSAASAAPRSSGRGGDDLSKLRVSDLQGLAQQLGISVTARMRKGDLVAAIQERRGGGRSATARTSEETVTRVASAGVGAPRPLNQDAMEADTSVRSGIGDAAPVGAGIGDAGSEQAGHRDRRPECSGAGEQLAPGQADVTRVVGRNVAHSRAPFSGGAGAARGDEQLRQNRPTLRQSGRGGGLDDRSRAGA